ncbi:L-glyceraldehyde 3-phosphate reductase [Sphingomonas antarctica]|uniref:aldo/keto reductase n=1 Tax=Sphingomonas antarctica TaxID=2040274 RepID=UPI0039E8CAD7
MNNPAIGGCRLVLGGNVFGWTADRETSFAILDAFVAAGGSMIDTADVYSAWVPGHRGGESESVIGEWLRASGKRDSVRIATKVGMLPGEGGKGLAPARIAAACDASLQRLGVERIDLYYAHRDDPATPQDEVAAAFATLVQAGKVGVLGASNFTPERLRSALDLGTPYRVFQPEYNLVARGALAEGLRANRDGDLTEYEGALQDLCVKRGVAVLPYFGLASGFLTGKYRSAEDVSGARAMRVKDYMKVRGLAVLKVMDGVAEETGATHAQIALAWLNAQPGIAAPIASATSVLQLHDLLAATELTLSPDQLARLDASGG